MPHVPDLLVGTQRGCVGHCLVEGRGGRSDSGDQILQNTRRHKKYGTDSFHRRYIKPSLVGKLPFLLVIRCKRT